MSTATMNKIVHEGRNIKRFREMLNLTQEALASDLGDDWTQKKISLLEGKEKVEPEILEQVARALKVPAEAIRNFDEEKAIVNIQNNYDGSTLNHSANYQYNHQPTFNPLDKVIELYERLLQAEREKAEMAERLLNEKKGGK